MNHRVFSQGRCACWLYFITHQC